MNIDLTTYTGLQLREEIENLRRISLFDPTTYNNCEKSAKPYIDEMNRRSEKIAKEFNKRPLKVSFKTFRGKKV